MSTTALALLLGAAACDAGGGPQEVGTVESALTLYAAFEPAAPTVGRNHLAITLVDASGAGIAGAWLSVVPTMVHMGHGSTEIPVISDLGDGHYDAYPVTFQMPGSWRVSIEAEHQGDSCGLDLDVSVR